MLGLLAGRWGWNQARDEAVVVLLQRAESATAVFTAAETAQLSGTAADLGSPAYAAVKQRLQRMRLADPNVRFLYLFRFQPESGRVIFLADSEPPESAEISLPGDD